MAQPDYNSYFNEIWGWPDERSGIPGISIASNVIIGTNPPYSVTDFLTLYPKFGGKPTLITGTVDGTTAVVTGVSSILGLLAGQYVIGPGVQPGTTLVSASGSTVVLSKNTIAAGSPVQLQVFVTPLVPMAVLNAYIYLATSSIFQARWCEMWWIAMALFIAHYATLWLQGEASGPNATGAQAAASGLAQGIETAESAGDVSYSTTPVIIDGFGTFNLTLYGQELATWAAVIGSGSMLLY